MMRVREYILGSVIGLVIGSAIIIGACYSLGIL